MERSIIGLILYVIGEKYKAIGRSLLKFFTFVILFIWQLPQNIIAIIMMPFIGKLSLIKYDKNCFAFKATKMSGSISLGSFIFLCEIHAKEETSIAHEFGHVWWSHAFGPLYLITIGIPSIMWAAFRNNEKHPCYYSFYTEKIANDKANLESVMSLDGKSCFLVFKK